jgi:uncharacterized PurR-regulated membrane protein YhhQ (DUF165 family)
VDLSRAVGLAAFFAFMGCIPLANWMIGHVGTVCVPHGPCLIPVAPGLMAPSGVVMAGAALVLRDLVQRCLGKLWGAIAISLGTVLSVFVAGADLALASGAAFVLSETADFLVFTPAQKWGLVRAVVISAPVGLAVDSVAFLWLAFENLDFLAGQIVGKAWAVLVSVPLVRLVRRVAPTAA